MIGHPSNRREATVRHHCFLSEKRLQKPYPRSVVTAVLLLLFAVIFIVAGALQVVSSYASPSPKEETPEIKPLPPFRSEPARGKFLIASRKLIDPNFSETVVLLIDYGSHGAMGVIINRPTRIRLSEVLTDIKGLKERPDILYIGGPVQRDRLMLMVASAHRPEEAHTILEDVYIGVKPETIQEMIKRSDPRERFRAYAGYAGWSPGQLDREITQGDWHILRADPVTIFDKEASKIWPDLIRYFTSKWVENALRHKNQVIHPGNPCQYATGVTGRRLPLAGAE